jgi:hypothetical protein
MRAAWNLEHTTTRAFPAGLWPGSRRKRFQRKKFVGWLAKPKNDVAGF